MLKTQLLQVENLVNSIKLTKRKPFRARSAREPQKGGHFGPKIDSLCFSLPLGFRPWGAPLGRAPGVLDLSP